MIVIAIGEKEFQNRNLPEEGMFMFHLSNQILHLLHLMKNTFQIRQCEERRCRSPKKYVRERKKDQEVEKTESEDTDSDSITEDNKTGKRRSRSQQRRLDKSKVQIPSFF